MQQALIIIKPDGIKRRYVGIILTQLEMKGFKIIGTKLMIANKDIITKHYAEHIDKPYYSVLESSMMSGPIFVIAIEGPSGTIEKVKKLFGKTGEIKTDQNEDRSNVRGSYSALIGCNLCHVSDSFASAKRELTIWFKDDELINTYSI
jgi:nucleoside-diphosphate kinase